MDDQQGSDEPVAMAEPDPVAPHPDEVLDPVLLLRRDVHGLRVDINATHAAAGELYGEVASLRAELSSLAESMRPDPEAYDTLAVVHEQVWEVRRRVDDMASPAAPPAVDLRSVGTKRLGKELARRANPLRPSFWRRARRSLR